MAKRAAHKRERDPDALHGLLPLVVDADTGAVRFARAGDGLPPIREPSELPEARLEVVAFGDSHALAAWHAAVREFAGNHVAVAVPEIDRPRFALLTRFDMEAHPGATLEEAVPLRFPAGRVDAAGLEDATRHSRADAERTHRETSAVRAMERDWAAELAELRRMPSVDVHVSGRGGGGPTVVTKSTRHTASWSLRRTADGRYEASMSALMMRTTPKGMDGDLLALLDRRMADAGIGRVDLTFTVGLGRLDAQAVAALAAREELVHATLREIDRTTSLRGVVSSMKEDSDLLSLLRVAASGMPVALCPWHGRDGAIVSPKRGLLSVGQFVHRRAVEKGCLEEVWSREHDDGRDAALAITDFGRRLLTDGVAELAEALGNRPEPEGHAEPSGRSLPLTEAVGPVDADDLELVAARMDELRQAAEGRKGAAPLAVRIAAHLVGRRHGAEPDGDPRP